MDYSNYVVRLFIATKNEINLVNTRGLASIYYISALDAALSVRHT